MNGRRWAPLVVASVVIGGLALALMTAQPSTLEACPLVDPAPLACRDDLRLTVVASGWLCVVVMTMSFAVALRLRQRPRPRRSLQIAAAAVVIGGALGAGAAAAFLFATQQL